MRTDRSWNKKKIPGFRCSSNRRHAFAESGPTNVRVYVCRGSGTAAAGFTGVGVGGETGIDGGYCAYAGCGVCGW